MTAYFCSNMTKGGIYSAGNSYQNGGEKKLKLKHIQGAEMLRLCGVSLPSKKHVTQHNMTKVIVLRKSINYIYIN
jgi:hypothetical protein